MSLPLFLFQMVREVEFTTETRIYQTQRLEYCTANLCVKLGMVNTWKAI